MAVYEACRYRVKTAVCPRSQPLMPDNVPEIVSGGARDRRLRRRICAEERYPLTEFLPRLPPLAKKARRLSDPQIIDYADELLAFWDGHSRGTDFVIRQARLKKKKITVIRMDATPKPQRTRLRHGAPAALFRPSASDSRNAAVPPHAASFFAAPRGLPAGKCAGFPALRPPCFPHLWADTKSADSRRKNSTVRKRTVLFDCCRNTAALRFRKGPRVKTLGLPKHRRFIVFERLRDPPLAGQRLIKRGRNRPYAQGGIGGLRPFQHGREILLNAADHLYTRIQTAERDESVGIAEIL